jgi:hypothetical protein
MHSVRLELSPKVLQPNGKVLRATIPQSPEQSLLLRCLDPAFKVAPAQCLILGLVLQQSGQLFPWQGSEQEKVVISHNGTLFCQQREVGAETSKGFDKAGQPPR